MQHTQWHACLCQHLEVFYYSTGTHKAVFAIASAAGTAEVNIVHMYCCDDCQLLLALICDWDQHISANSD